MKNTFLNKKLFTALFCLCFTVCALRAEPRDATELTAAIASAKNKKQSRAAYVARAEYYFSIADYENALNDYKQILELKPPKRQRYDVYIKAGKLLSRARRFEEALDDFKNAEFLYPARPAAKVEMGKLYLKTGLYYLAETKLLEALDADNTDRHANRYLGDIYFTQKNYSKALNYYEASEPSYTNKKLMLNMAESYRNADNKDEAIKLLTGFLNASAQDTDVLLALARIYIQTNEEAAENYLLEIINAQPQNLAANMYLAQIYLDTGKIEAAAAALARAAALAPNLASVNLLQSRLYYMQGNYMQAKTNAYQAYLKSKTPAVKASAARLIKFLNENY